MTLAREEVEKLQKRLQRGTTSYEAANSLHADCYGTPVALLAMVEEERARCARLAAAPGLCLKLLKGRTHPDDALVRAIESGLPIPDTSDCKHPNTRSIDPMDNGGQLFRCLECGVAFNRNRP